MASGVQQTASFIGGALEANALMRFANQIEGKLLGAPDAGRIGADLHAGIHPVFTGRNYVTIDFYLAKSARAGGAGAFALGKRLVTQAGYLKAVRAEDI